MRKNPLTVYIQMGKNLEINSSVHPRRMRRRVTGPGDIAAIVSAQGMATGLGSSASCSSSDVTVLVYVGERKRAVSLSFSANETRKACLLAAVSKAFQDADIHFDDAVVQMKSEEWGGGFLDVKEDDVIPDTAEIRIVEMVRFNK